MVHLCLHQQLIKILVFIVSVMMQAVIVLVNNLELHNLVSYKGNNYIDLSCIKLVE